MVEYQEKLVSGQNIKTLNSQSLLGSGNIDINSAEWGSITGTLSDQADLQAALSGKQDTLVSGQNIKTINSTSLLGSGDIEIEATPEVYIQDTEPTDENWKLWVDPNEELTSLGTEVTNSLEGDETYLAPSVSAVNDALEEAMKENQVYSTNEIRIGTWIDGKPLYRKVITATLNLSNMGDHYVPSNITNLSQTIKLNYIINVARQASLIVQFHQ